MSETVSSMVARAREVVEHLSPADVAKEIDGGDAVLVDLREPAEREASGAIDGSLHVPRGMLEFRADPASPYHDEALQPEARIILYCASGGRSALAAATLQSMGYRNVAHLDGGYNAWVEANDTAGAS